MHPHHYSACSLSETAQKPPRSPVLHNIGEVVDNRVGTWHGVYLVVYLVELLSAAIIWGLRIFEMQTLRSSRYGEYQDEPRPPLFPTCIQTRRLMTQIDDLEQRSFAT